MMDWSTARVGYAPYADDMASPGDRRRFGFYAHDRGIAFELADASKDYDLVYLSTRADLSTWSRYRGRAKIVFEVIDSYFALSEANLKNRMRGIAKFASRELSRPTLSYKKMLAEMAGRADAVVCSTLEQKEQLSEYCSNVHIILDAHDEVGTLTKQDYGAQPPFNLIWEGLAYTLDAFETIAPALDAVAAHRPLALHLITDLRSHRYLGRFLAADTQKRARRIFDNCFVYQWNQHALAALATSCDLGVIPLDLEDPLSRGKPENKLLLLWRMGIPTLTSASPAYRRAMDASGLDMTCETAADWEKKLLRYLEDESLRENAGVAGRRFVHEVHSKDSVLARWDALFASVMGS